MTDTLILNIDGALIGNRDELHNTIAWQLQFPDYYGRNLDALWDLLSAWSTPLTIELTNAEVLLQHLGDYGESVLQLFQEAAEENDRITIRKTTKP